MSGHDPIFSRMTRYDRPFFKFGEPLQKKMTQEEAVIMNKELNRVPYHPEFNPNPMTFKAVTPIKVGRNEPCPCWSGKKYKRCCIDK